MAAELKARWVMVLTGAMLMLAVGLVAKADWPLAAPAQAIPHTGITAEQLAKLEVEHTIEVYTLYYDFDNDGDIDIAYALNGPIRIIESKPATDNAPPPATPAGSSGNGR